MRPWRASLLHSKQSGSMRLSSARAPRRGRRCSSPSRCFTIGSACTQPWATARRLRRGPAWRQSPYQRRPDILIYPFHTKGEAQNERGNRGPRLRCAMREYRHIYDRRDRQELHALNPYAGELWAKALEQAVEKAGIAGQPWFVTIIDDD